MEIGKSNKNFKDGKPKYFNCKTYRHMARNCKKPKEEKDTRKCYKCRQIEHIAKNCRTKQRMKKQSIQKDLNTDTKEEDKQNSFEEGPK